MASDIDQYIQTFPDDAQSALKEVRAIINETVPEAEETISYAIPTFKLNGQYLIYFAGYKKHIGVYPVPTGNADFDKEFAGYKTSGKGAIQLPLNKPMPKALIKKIVQYRIQETKKKVKA